MKYTKEQFREFLQAGAAYRPIIEAQCTFLKENADAVAEFDPELARVMRAQADATLAVYDHIRVRFESN